MRSYLVGDIGGTKTHLAVFSDEKGPREPITQQKFPSTDYVSLEDIVEKFLKETGLSVEQASFAVAGPIVTGKVKLTNIPWVVDQEELCKKVGLPEVILMNDLLAIAASVPYLTDDDLHTLNEGVPVEGGAFAVVAPGTGLGEAFLTLGGSRYWAHPSEGSHADFSPMNDIQEGLLKFLHARLEHVSYEWVCSGIGIANIYNYLKDSKYADEPEWLTKELSETNDPVPIIARCAKENMKGAELCIATMNMFVSILGAEAGNMALKVLATGGVYISGGIPPRILTLLDRGDFMDSFTNKGRMKSLLSEIPVKVITNPSPALLGAAYTLIEKLERQRA